MQVKKLSIDGSMSNLFVLLAGHLIARRLGDSASNSKKADANTEQNKCNSHSDAADYCKETAGQWILS